MKSHVLKVLVLAGVIAMQMTPLWATQAPVANDVGNVTIRPTYTAAPARCAFPLQGQQVTRRKVVPREGDTFATISQRVYGTASHATELAKNNGKDIAAKLSANSEVTVLCAVTTANAP